MLTWVPAPLLPSPPPPASLWMQSWLAKLINREYHGRLIAAAAGAALTVRQPGPRGPAQ